MIGTGGTRSQFPGFIVFIHQNKQCERQTNICDSSGTDGPDPVFNYISFGCITAEPHFWPSRNGSSALLSGKYDKYKSVLTLDLWRERKKVMTTVDFFISFLLNDFPLLCSVGAIGLISESAAHCALPTSVYKFRFAGRSFKFCA